MTHTIEVRDLRVVAIVGVLPEERARTQPIRLDLVVDIEAPDASSTDDVGDTVDYGALCELATATVLASRQQLLETACDEVASALLAADPRVTAATVTATKLRPPLALDVATVGVRRRTER